MYTVEDISGAHFINIIIKKISYLKKIFNINLKKKKKKKAGEIMDFREFIEERFIKRN